MAVKKLYTEGYISDIAEAIRAKNGSENKYTTAEMSAAIASLVGPNEYIKNNMLSIKRVAGIMTEPNPTGIVFRHDATHFYCLPSNGKVNAGLAFNYTNKKFVPTGIQFQFDVGYRGMYWPDHGKTYLLTGIDSAYPLMNADLSTVSNNTEWDNLKFPGSSNSDLMDIPLQLINMHPTYTHPLLLEAYANERIMSFNDFLSAYSVNDVFNIINDGFVSPKYYGREYPVLRGYMFVDSNNNLIVCVFLDLNGYRGEIYYDGEKLVSSTDCYGDRYTPLGSCRYSKHDIDLNAVIGVDPYLVSFTTEEIINSRFIYSTADIKDANNNVLFEANVSLSEFSSWINWEQ